MDESEKLRRPRPPTGGPLMARPPSYNEALLRRRRWPSAEFEPLAQAFQRTSRPPPAVVPRIVPGDCIFMIEGPSRRLNSLVASELAVSVALGDAPFGAERFRPREPAPVLYLNEIDPDAHVTSTFRALLAGRGVAELPARLFVGSLNMTPISNVVEWCNMVQRHVDQTGARLLITESIAQWPTENRWPGFDDSEVFLHLARLQKSTGLSLGLVASRASSKNMVTMSRFKYRASNVVAHVAATLTVIPSQRALLLVPRGYKFSSDPDRISVDWPDEGEGEDRAFRFTVSRFQVSASARQRVLEVVREQPGLMKSAVWRRVGGSKRGAFEAVKSLLHEGVIKVKEVGQGHALYVVEPNDGKLESCALATGSEKQEPVG